MNKLSDLDIKYLRGVGEARAKLLDSELNIRTFRDLVYTFPFRYVDRSRFYSIAELKGDMPNIQIKGKFVKFSTEGEGAKKRLVGLFSDGRSLIETVWFRALKTITSTIEPNKEYVLFGKPSFFKGYYSMVHPEIEPFNKQSPPHGLRGVYSLTERLRQKNFTSKTIQKLVENMFDKVAKIDETLPLELVAQLHLMPLYDALKNIHNPESLALLQAAKERLKFEELFYIQLHILRYSKERLYKIKGPVFNCVGEKFNDFYNNVLPFSLTGAQKRVIKEMRSDMRSGRQMNRLLQGDVGSGKTLVAFMSMLIAIDNKYQACMMAPTEILAVQHYETLRKWVEPIGVRVELLTGSVKARKRSEIHAGLEDGSVDILVGTHAVIEDNVRFLNLGFVIIDEQHRFGVAQRAKLWRKNDYLPPHVLVMTATPIPRTLAMTVYGDLDVSVIDELPPGRKPVRTMLYYDDQRYAVFNTCRQQLEQGRQIYIVYPLIYENEKLSLNSLEKGYEEIVDMFKDYRVCYVHGKMKPEEKEYQMNLFIEGKARIMVATTVIEVGVNVPNASVMVIENAERFGLSQLHQLRGRVGRGADQSYCILMGHRKSAAETRQRLNIMTETTDGFLISEADMKMRGPGDMEGTQQSGLAFDLKIANLSTDGNLVQRARTVAQNLIESNPKLVARNLGTDVQLQTKGEGTVVLSHNSELIVSRELKYRFPSAMDWGLIS